MSDYTEKNSNLIPKIDIPCFAWNSQAEQGLLFFKAKSLQADGSGGVLRQPIKRHTVRCSSTHRIIWHQREYTTLFMYIPQMVR